MRYSLCFYKDFVEIYLTILLVLSLHILYNITNSNPYLICVQISLYSPITYDKSKWFLLLNYKATSTLLCQFESWATIVQIITTNIVIYFGKEEYRTQTEGVNMCEALIQLKQEGIKVGKEQEIEQGIKNTIIICKNLGASIEMTIQQIICECSLNESKAKEYVDKYWN